MHHVDRTQSSESPVSEVPKVSNERPVICLDLDNTLAHTEQPANRIAGEQAVEVLKAKLTKEEAPHLFDEAGERKFVEDFVDRFPSVPFGESLPQVAGEHGILQMDKEEITQHCYDQNEAVIREIEEASLAIAEDLDNTLAHLANTETKAYVVTSSERRRAAATLRAAKVIDYFPRAHDLVSAETDCDNNVKPSPAAYKEAIRRENEDRAHHAKPPLSAEMFVAVEDSVNGVRSAKGAGMKVIIGTLEFTPEHKREETRQKLLAEDVVAVVEKTSDIVGVIDIHFPLPKSATCISMLEMSSSNGANGFHSNGAELNGSHSNGSAQSNGNGSARNGSHQEEVDSAAPPQ